MDSSSLLEKIGFVTQTDLDPCLFISDQVIGLVYVDNTLFFSPKEEYIDEVIQKFNVTMTWILKLRER
jgi:hypothetical protein